MNRRTSRILVFGLPLAAIVIAALLIRSRPAPPRLPPADRVPSVATSPVRAGSDRLPVFGNGTVRPRAEVDLAPQVSGRVVRVSPSLVSGGRFRAGEILVELDDAEFRNAVQQARALVAQDSVALLQADEEARIAREEYEQFRTRADVTTEANPLVLREPQLQAARAALARAQAQLADADLALERTRIRAPFDGVVRSETVDPGAFANVGQGLARIFASDAAEVVVPLTDDDAAMIPGIWSLRPGSDGASIPARVSVEYRGRSYSWDGYVDRVQTALDELSRTIDVVVRVEDPFRPGTPREGDSSSLPSPPLLVGQYTEVEIQGREGSYHVISRRALRPGNEVWAVADSLIRIVPVEVLQQVQDSVFVTGDFRPGDLAVTEGISLAANGMRVRPSGAGS
jgi:RND family efflux transporter MFP subunit